MFPLQRRLLELPVRPLTLRLALPGLGAMLASGAGTLFDALFLARSGAQATAAVGVCLPLTQVVQTIGFTLGMGAGSVVSRCIGSASLSRGKKRALAEAKETAGAAAALTLVLCTLLALAAMPFAPTLVRLLGAGEETARQAAVYARFVLALAPVSAAGLLLSSLLRAQGHMLSYLYASAAGTALGAVTMYALCLRLSLGVWGAGAALAARESCVLGVLVARMRSAELLLPLSRLRLRFPGSAACKRLAHYGVPTLVRQAAASASSALLTRVSAGFGDHALAGMSLAVRVLTLISGAVIGVGQGFQPVCGAALGAGNLPRVRDGYAFCRRVVTLSLLACGALLFFFADEALLAFGTQEEVASFSARILRVQAPVLFAQGAVILMNMLVQQLGMPVRAALIATSRQGIFLPPLLFLLPLYLGETGLILAQSASDLCALTLSLLLMRGIWRSSSLTSRLPAHYNTDITHQGESRYEKRHGKRARLPAPARKKHCPSSAPPRTRKRRPPDAGEP